MIKKNGKNRRIFKVKQTSINKDLDRSMAAVAPPKMPLNINNNHLSLMPGLQQQSSAVSINNPLNNPCLSSPCLNSGMCITLMDDKGIPRGYICRCTNPQDSGAFCEDRNFCFSNPCLNGGSCSNTLNGYACKCTTHWTGFNCNIPANVVVPPPPQPQPPILMTMTSLNCFDHSKRFSIIFLSQTSFSISTKSIFCFFVLKNRHFHIIIFKNDYKQNLTKNNLCFKSKIKRYRQN